MPLTVGGVAIDLSANAVTIVTEMNRAARAVQQASGQMQGSLSRWQGGFQTAERGISGSLSRIGGALRGLQTILVSLGLGVGVREIIRYGDAWKQAEAQLRLVSDTAEQAAVIHERLFETAQQLGVDVDALSTVYARTARNAESLGVGTADIMAATRALAAAIKLSGTSATEASNALIQLSQSFASGVLRGDELRSVSEQMPVVLDAIAAATGKTRQEVINYARENGLAANLVIDSLKRQEAAWTAQAETVGGTVEQALTRVRNAIEQLAGRAGEAGAFQPLIDGLNRVAAAFASDEAVANVRTFFEKMNTFIQTSREEFNRLAYVMTAVLEGRFGDALAAATGKIKEFEESFTNLSQAQAQALGVPFLSAETFGPPRPPAGAGGPPLPLTGAAPAGGGAAARLPPIEETRQIARRQLFVDLPAFGPPEAGPGVTAEMLRGQEIIRQNEELAETYKTINAAAEMFANTVSRGLTQAITKASTFGEALRNVVQSLAEAALQALIFQGISAGIGTAGGGGLLGAIFPKVGGARALGGPVAAGTAYRVGERGPEMFVPAMAGKIVPEAAGTTGSVGGSGNTYNIYADQIAPGTVARILNMADQRAGPATVNARARGKIRERAPF